MTDTTAFPRILNAAGSYGAMSLDQAEHLASYDGILFDPLWFFVHGGVEYYQAAPGEACHAQTVGDVTARQARSDHRSSELQAFLERGGVLVVRGLAPAYLVAGPALVVDTWSWITRAVAAQRLATHPLPGAPARVVHGTDLHVVDAQHLMAVAMTAIGEYDAELAPWLLDLDGARVTAENRAGNAVGIDIPYGRGAVIIVPTRRGADTALHVGLLGSWLFEHPPLTEPLLTAERALDEEDRVISVDTGARHNDVARRRREVGEAKRKVLALDHVDRAYGHWRRATIGTVNDRTALQELFALLEIVEAAVGERRTIPRVLGVDRAVVDDIGRFSNQGVHGIRHTTDQALQPLPAGTVRRCREHGTTLLRALLDWEVGKLTGTP